ncbi:MAG: hypothetical protein AAFV07_05690 [Bacteroidota bacterium]
MTNADAKYWEETLEGLRVNDPAARDYWSRLEAGYTGVSRHYHNLEHLSTMFGVLQPLSLEHPWLVRLAVWFHDLIYDIKRKDNEAQSAQAAVAFAEAHGIPEADRLTLEALIMSTAGHHPRWDHPDCHAMLDADLAILAMEEEVYDTYAENIRKEYASYPRFMYKKGRRKVLRSFLERPQLYYTPTLRGEWEPRARANLARELKQWGG